MQAQLYWDISEMVGEAVMFNPALVNTVPHFRELAADLAALALRDMGMGTHNCLDEYIDQNLGSEFQFLGLFFRSHSIRWYREITSFTDQTTRDYDWYEIDDIVQLSPLLLLVKLNVGYYYENPSACMDITDLQLT